MIHSEGRFLWIKRGAGVPKPDYWTPPSGHVEPGEAPADTVVREMAEELDIVVRPVRQVWQCLTDDGAYLLDWWLAEIESGEPRVADDEVADVRWVTPRDIHMLSPTFAEDLRFIDEVWPTLD